MATVTSHLPGTPCWVDLTTKDPEAARAFYAGLFGWTYDIGGPEIGHYAMIKLGDRIVGGLGGGMPGADQPSAWTPYLSSTDAEATLTALKAHGGTLLVGPMHVPGQGVQVICADPTGAVFGFWEPRPFPGFGVFDEPGSFCWCEVNTPDAAKDAAFYATVFGLDAERLTVPFVYHVLSKAGQRRCGVLQMNEQWAGVPPHWMVYFAVADTDAAVARVEQLGGKVGVKPFDHPRGRLAVVSDPTGAWFTVMKPSRLAMQG